MLKKLLICMAGGILVGGAQGQSFTNVSEEFGIECVYAPGGFMGGGAAIQDINGDGLPDIISATGELENVAVLLNTGSAFELDDGVIGITAYGENQQVLFGDYDNDGDRDLFVGIWGSENFLFRNNGNGTFTDVTSEAGVAGGETQTTCALWFDYDRDGMLDLYVCNYGWDGVSNPPSADEHNVLYRNNGDGTFADVTSEAGVADADFRRPLSVLAYDFDYDLDADIVIAMDKEQRSTFFRNEGNGTFTDSGAEVGFEPHIDGMGLAIGDVDGNGWLDFTISNGPPGNHLYMNNGNGGFTQEAEARGAQVFNESWGSHMFDCDFDGDADIYVAATGDLNGNANDALLINDGTGHFTEEASAFGIVENSLSFGAAFGDVDNNGATDIFLCNSSSPAMLFLADAPTRNWYRLRLEGAVSNRDGIGATVRVTAAGLTQVFHTTAGSSFESCNDPRLILAIPGEGEAVVTVTWPSGILDVFENLAPNQEHLLLEGSASVDDGRTVQYVPGNVNLSLYPNPFNSIVTIELGVTNSARQLNVAIYNTLGQQIYAFPSRRYDIGSTRLQWLGNSTNRTEVGSGLYFVRISDDHSTTARPLHFIK